jgi:hypothetical protein
MEEILEETLRELSVLRQAVLAMPEQPHIDFAIEAIDFYERELPKMTDLPLMLEFCGRAIADVRHEVAALQHGEGSTEAEAVYDQEDRELSKLIRTILNRSNRGRIVEAAFFLLHTISRGIKTSGYPAIVR